MIEGVGAADVRATASVGLLPREHGTWAMLIVPWMATAAIEVALLAVAASALRLGGLSSDALLGFAPLLLQFVVDTARLDRPPPLKRVGILATVSSILFALFVIRLA